MVNKFKKYKVSAFGWIFLIVMIIAGYVDYGVDGILGVLFFAPILYGFGIIQNILTNVGRKTKTNLYEEDYHNW